VDRGTQAKSEFIPDIHDFEIRKFLKRLNEERTKNITVIFDCCHSGSMTRGIDESNSSESVRLGNHNSCSNPHNARMAPPIDHIPSKIKDLYLSERDLALQSKSAISTHVCMAACRDDELAWEDRNEGMFTKLLLCKLDELPLLSTSYEELEKRFDQLPRQHPIIYASPELKRSLLFQIGTNS
jgi:Caspase domain